MKKEKFYRLKSVQKVPTPELVEGTTHTIGGIKFGYFNDNGQFISIELTTGVATCFGGSTKGCRNNKIDLIKWNTEHIDIIKDVLQKGERNFNEYRKIIADAKTLES